MYHQNGGLSRWPRCVAKPKSNEASSGVSETELDAYSRLNSRSFSASLWQSAHMASLPTLRGPMGSA
jgi:hypothetical protein